MSPRAAGAACLALWLCACVAPPVERRAWGSAEGAFEKVAVVPFRPWPVQARAGAAIGGPAAQASADVTQMVSEALAARGVEVIPADAVAPWVIGEQDGTAAFDPGAAAQAAAGRLGASGVVIGRVVRYRDKTGEAVGTLEPASVAFEVTLYDPQGRPLRAAVFDETQKPLSDNLWNAFRYPGRGSRWLSVDELARWGAGAAVEALLAP